MNQTDARTIQVTGQDFQQQVLEAEVPVLVDFWAEWCAPCRALGPIIESLSQQFGDDVKTAKVDVDRNQQLSMQFNIRSIPTVILFDKGEIVEKIVGVRPRAHYEATLNRQLAAAA